MSQWWRTAEYPRRTHALPIFRAVGLNCCTSGCLFVRQPVIKLTSSDLGGARGGQRDAEHTCSTQKYRTCCVLCSQSRGVWGEKRKEAGRGSRLCRGVIQSVPGVKEIRLSQANRAPARRRRGALLVGHTTSHATGQLVSVADSADNQNPFARVKRPFCPLMVPRAWLQAGAPRPNLCSQPPQLLSSSASQAPRLACCVTKSVRKAISHILTPFISYHVGTTRSQGVRACCESCFSIHPQTMGRMGLLDPKAAARIVLRNVVQVGAEP